MPTYLKLKNILHLIEFLFISIIRSHRLVIVDRDSLCFGLQTSPMVTSVEDGGQLAFDVPGGKLLKALLGMSIGSSLARGAEAAGRSAGYHQGWDRIDGTGASGRDVAKAIGTEKCAGLRASCDAQQSGRRH